jgi:serine phosphatase RsbU (regulator of sigma subunit)
VSHTSLTGRGQPQLISVVSPAVRAEYAVSTPAARLLDDLGTRSHIAVPLSLANAARGALMLGLTDPGRPHYSPDDLTFIQDLARRVEVVLAATALRRQEHDIAVRLQRSLLPDQLVTHPRLQISAQYAAGNELLEVGGDWYDTFSWPDGRIGVIVGDVVGHNMDSAASMGRLRAATAALVAYLPSNPAAVLDALDTFARTPNGTNYATAACIVIDPATGHLTYATAGHPPPFILTPGQPSQRLNAAPSPPLSVTAHPQQPRSEAQTTLQPGTLVVMYSDGLIERRSHSLEHGLRNLETVATSLIDEPLDQLTEQIITQLTNDSPTDDDIVIICLRYRP